MKEYTLTGRAALKAYMLSDAQKISLSMPDSITGHELVAVLTAYGYKWADVAARSAVCTQNAAQWDALTRSDSPE